MLYLLLFFINLTFPNFIRAQDDYALPSGFSSAEYGHNEAPGPIASSCLARIRLAASFDPNIPTQINRYLDSMRFDKLRSFVCEKTAYFCDEQQQHEVGEIFRNHQKSMDIVENVRSQFSSTEKDQLNMMENLNDSLAEQAFYVYKFHQLPPLTLAILTATKSTLTTALSQNQPDPNLSRAMGTFSPADLLTLQNMSPADFPEEIRAHLAKCQITSHDVLQDTISFLLALRNSKMGSYSNSK
ncbi:unnamed protein product [Caenorhabditis angaria]|uniref:Uncharacterized protein n=1 Tax=Caenorhabditis angaria TaxID=860376 RepID=A0A9P1IJP1_9PELO|nr:unnamed protein product [Caenorhabditis angaria]